MKEKTINPIISSQFDASTFTLHVLVRTWKFELSFFFMHSVYNFTQPSQLHGLGKLSHPHSTFDIKGSSSKCVQD
jgi:hypothetical protein